MEEGDVLNLLESMFEACCILTPTRTDDLYGSHTDAWADGAKFDAAIIKNNTTEATIAEKQGITEIFTVVVRKGFPLEYHAVFRRISDGQIFRVTSDVRDSAAPAASTVQIAKVTAERWELPNA